MNKFFTLLLIIGFIFLTYFLILYFLHGGNSNFLEIDSCLDKGGIWDYKNNLCKKV